MKPALIAAFAALAALLAAPAAAQTRVPARMPIENLRAANLVSLEILDGEGKVVARLARPLAAGGKGALRLARARGCDMTVQARFDDEGEVDETLNLCREKVLRFRD
jgi:hypothetical protein